MAFRTTIMSLGVSKIERVTNITCGRTIPREIMSALPSGMQEQRGA